MYLTDEMFIEVPLFSETSPALTNSWLRACELSKEFYETFWEDIKDVFINSLKQAKIRDSLSILKDKQL